MINGPPGGSHPKRSAYRWRAVLVALATTLMWLAGPSASPVRGQAPAAADTCAMAPADKVTAAVDLFVVPKPNAHAVDALHMTDNAHANLYFQKYASWKTDVGDSDRRQDLPNVALRGDGCVPVKNGRALLPLSLYTGMVDSGGANYMLTLVMDVAGASQIAARWTIEVYARPSGGSDLVDYQLAFIYPTLTHWGELSHIRDHRTARDVQSFALQFAPANRSQVLLQSFSPRVQRSKTPLLLVHGIHGNAGYFGKMRSVLKDSGNDVWEILYPNDQNIRFSAGLLGQAIQWIGQLYDVPKVDIVAHSMGGLVSRAYIEGLGLLASDEGAHAPGDRAVPYRGQIRKWMSLGTPYYGHMWSRALTGAQLDISCSAGTSVQQALAALAPDGIPFAREEPALLQLASGSAFLWRLNELQPPMEVDVSSDWLTVTGHAPGFHILDQLTIGCLALDPINDNVVDMLSGHLVGLNVPAHYIELQRPLLAPFMSVHELLATDTGTIPDFIDRFVHGDPLPPSNGLPERVLSNSVIDLSPTKVRTAGLDVRYVDSPSSPSEGAALDGGFVGDAASISVLTVNANPGARTVASGFPVASAITRWSEANTSVPFVPLVTVKRFSGVMRDVSRALDVQVPGGPAIVLTPNTYRQEVVCTDKHQLELGTSGALHVDAVPPDAIKISWQTNRPAWATVRYTASNGVPNDLTLPEESADRTAILPDLPPGETIELLVTLHDPCQGLPIEAPRTVRLASTGGQPGQGVGSSTVLVLDASDSMSTTDMGGESRWKAAVAAAGRLLHMIGRENQSAGSSHVVAAVSFSDDATVLSPLTGDTQAALDAVAAHDTENGTQMATGLQSAIDLLSSGTTGRRIAVILSDGVAHDEDAVRALIPQLRAAADCIYTVGFGSSGSGLFGIFGSGAGVNEPFLRELAATTSCGAYYPAANAADLDHAYVLLRHQATGSVAADVTGTIAPGETTAEQPLVVPAAVGELHVTLDWPGSAVDLLLKDPTGRQVGPGYPGANIDTAGPPVYAIIDQPMAGTWHMSAFGRDLPEGPEPFSLVASTRGVSSSPHSQPSSGGGSVLLVVALLVGGVLWVARPRDGAGSSAQRAHRDERGQVVFRPAWPLAFVVTGDSPAPRVVAVNGAPWRIGRSDKADLVLSDPTISRLHCTVTVGPNGDWNVRDEKSSSGTQLNGRAVQQAALRPGDRLKLGRIRLEVIDPKRIIPSAGGARPAARPEV